MPQTAGSFQARLVSTAQSLTVDQLVSRADTPGNVAVCLSGGGSRALSAGMGQLRALSFLQSNGKSLLSQTKALSAAALRVSALPVGRRLCPL
jgi:glycerate kinase